MNLLVLWSTKIHQNCLWFFLIIYDISTFDIYDNIIICIYQGGYIKEGFFSTVCNKYMVTINVPSRVWPIYFWTPENQNIKIQLETHKNNVDTRSQWYLFTLVHIWHHLVDTHNILNSDSFLWPMYKNLTYYKSTWNTYLLISTEEEFELI